MYNPDLDDVHLLALVHPRLAGPRLLSKMPIRRHFETHNNLADAEMGIGDKDVDCKIHPDEPLDEHTGSDMSLDEDVESMTGLESTYIYPRVIPQQVYVAIAAETSDTAASRRPT